MHNAKDITVTTNTVRRFLIRMGPHPHALPSLTLRILVESFVCLVRIWLLDCPLWQPEHINAVPDRRALNLAAQHRGRLLLRTATVVPRGHGDKLIASDAERRGIPLR